jgi:hypothetical protein
MSVSAAAQAKPVEPEALVGVLHLKASGSGSNACSQRKLGNTETAYYLSSRESGVNDMYVIPYRAVCRTNGVQVSPPWF